MKPLKLFLISILCLCLNLNQGLAQTTAKSETDLSETFNGLKFRNIGPFRGGRSVAGCGVVGQPMLYYMGGTGSGIWKTTDAGISWHNISDGQLKTGTVGAIEVAPSDPNVIYVGMGEHAVRGVMTSHGEGVYKSTDAGNTWHHIGLPLSRHIAEIQIHPANPEIVFVAVQGALHGDSEDRGVYKSTDGGSSWSKVLYVDNTTGAADLSMDPSNPRILYAAMWDHRRYPWQVRSGGPGSAMFKSTDSGESWEKLEGGLPSEIGKSAIDVSAANTQVIYANIEAEGTKGGVYRSNDAGKTWKQTTSDRITVARAWYYIEIFADPVDENRVYVLNAPMLKSIDGGKSFKSISNPHGDQHHLWINSDNPENILLLNDGGACVTFNGGQTWSSQKNQPTVQFYRVITDNLFPYNVYGGQQDNSSVIISSRTGGGGITWKDWVNGPGCESAFLAFDPNNPVEVFGGCYQGNISALNMKTMEERDIMAYPTAGLGWTPSEMKYRFNWNAPIVASPQDPSVIFHGGNVVLKTTDRGINWTEISPDLTRDDKSKQGPGGAPYTNEGAGGEVYNTLSYIEASQHDSNVLWTGSDCGLVHVTTDGGANWTNVSPPNVGEALINAIDVSPHDSAAAYVTVTKYKFNDMSPMVYYTKDFGQNWQMIVTGIDSQTFVRVVREDLEVPGILYAGTEGGLYISWDYGQNWMPFQLNLPIVAINDLTFQDNDLVVATAGRSFWILDDLSAIQQSKDKEGAEVMLFQPKPSYRLTGGGRVRPGQSMGANPASGITFDYYLPEEMDSTEITFDILNSNGKVVRSYSNQKDKNFRKYIGGPNAEPTLASKKGVNRFTWNMREESVPGIQKVFLLGGYSGAAVAPGEYTINMTIADQKLTTTATLLADPRVEAEQADYDKQALILSRLGNMVSEIQNSVNDMQKVSKQIQSISEVIKSTNKDHELINLAKELNEKISNWENQLIQKDQKTFQDVINFPNRLNAEVVNLMGRIDGHSPVIGAGALQRMDDLMTQWNTIKSEKADILNTDVKTFNQAFKSEGLDVIVFPTMDKQ